MPRKPAPALVPSALSLLTLSALTGGTAARAQTFLTGHYDRARSRSGYKTAPGRSYAVAAPATFDGNGFDGLNVGGTPVVINGGAFKRNRHNGVYVDAGSTVTVNGGLFTGNNDGLLIGDRAVVTVHGGAFTNNALNGLSAFKSTVTVTGGTFRGNCNGLFADGAVSVTGGDFSGNTEDDLFAASAGASITLYGTGLRFTDRPADTTTLAAGAGDSLVSGTLTGTLRNNAEPSKLTFSLLDRGRITLVNTPDAVPDPPPASP